MKLKKGLLLLSGGIDSVIAGYLMKRYMEVIAVHFDNRPFTDWKEMEKSKRLAKKIGIKKMYIIAHGKNQLKVIPNTFRRYQCVLCRRTMFRIAEKIAKKEKCQCLITGENLGQVASQTLDNLINASKAVKIPITRPILCNDKNETIALARKIGTYEISIEPSVCCKMVPNKPITKSKMKKIKREEKRIDIKEIVNSSVKTAEIVYL